MTGARASMLATSGLSKQFGALRAVQDLDIEVRNGEIFGLIGPNGSGKTTALNLISGYLQPTAGSTIYLGEPVTGLRPARLAERGLIRTFQITSVFEQLTVEENLIHAAHLENRAGVLGSVFHTRAFRRSEAQLRAEALQTLARVGLQSRADRSARELSAGEHRYLEVAIALSARPRLLLLDEPAAGLNPEEATRLMRLIMSLRDGGITVMLVEHNMRMILGICTRVAVLNFGRKIAEGPPDEVREDSAVVSAYLGRRRGA